MYRPSKYEEHNQSLEKFANIFNNIGNVENVSIIYNEDENYSDDGKIILLNQNKEIYYDWEKRDKYFSDGKFTFATLGQFERKFHKTPKIGITIQCDSEEENVLVALHSEFNSKQSTYRTTDTNEREYGRMRTTSDFYIYNYSEIDKFISQLIDWANEDIEDFNSL